LGCISEAWARLVGALELEEEEELALDIAEDGCDDDPVPTSGNTGKTLEYFTNAWVKELSTSCGEPKDPGPAIMIAIHVISALRVTTSG